MGIVKRIRRKLLNKILGDNVFLLQSFQKNYRKSPMKYTALAAYIAPVSGAINFYEPVTEEEFIYSKEYYSELQDLLYVAKAEGRELIRVGRERDGGYIMLDDFNSGGIAYSFGISTDVSWDKDIAARGCDVFMYDHTIDGLPEENPRFHWQKLGIADGVTHDDNLKTLDELIKINHHENTRNMILKMDVEGAEWGCLSQASSETLSQFLQMTFEFHSIVNHEKPEQVLDVFRKINKTHQLIHIHANNNGPYLSFGKKHFCSLFELTYALKSKYTFSRNDDLCLPLSIDNANTAYLPEIPLGRWNEHVDIGERFTAHVRIY